MWASAKNGNCAGGDDDAETVKERVFSVDAGGADDGVAVERRHCAARTQTLLSLRLRLQWANQCALAPSAVQVPRGVSFSHARNTTDR